MPIPSANQLITRPARSNGHRNSVPDANQYLFGVTDAEATAIRPAYAAKDTTTGFANVTVAYPITDAITAVGQVGYEDLGDNQDSPLVEEASSTSIGLGLIWTF